VQRGGLLFVSRRFSHRLDPFDQIKTVGGFTFAKNHFLSAKMGVHGKVGK